MGGSDAAQRRPLHVIRGADQEFKNKVDSALSDLELTKEVKVLQLVMDQVTAAVIQLQTKSVEQEDANDVIMKRIGAVGLDINNLDRDVNQLGAVSKDADDQLDDHMADIEARFSEFQTAHEERNTTLHSLLAAQELALNSRIDEFKALFARCDELFAGMAGTKTAGAPHSHKR